MEDGRRGRWALVVVLFLLLSSTTVGMGSAIAGDAPPVYNPLKGFYTTIQEAVDSADSGDVILVGPGEFPEPIYINKPLALIGDGPDTTYTSTVIVGSSQLFDGDTFQNVPKSSNWNRAAGITTNREMPLTPISGVTVKNCNFKNLQHGIYLFGARASLIDNCVFTDCNRGISIQNHVAINRQSSHNTIKNCEFYRMTSLNDKEGEAIAINDTDYNVVENCYIDDCEWGVMIYKGDYNTVKDCEIVNAIQGAMYYYSISSKVTVTNNIIRDCNATTDFLHCNGFDFSGNEIQNCTDPNRIMNSNSFKVNNNKFNNTTILLDRSRGGTFTGNTFSTSDRPAFALETSSSSHYDHTIATTNKVGGNPYHYYYNTNDVALTDTTSGGIVFAYCSRPTIDTCDVVDGDGIRMVNSVTPYIKANVTNSIYGIDVVGSPGGVLVGCLVNASDRGLYGIRMLNSVGTQTSESRIEVRNGIPAWQIEGGDKYVCFNTSFPYNAVEAKTNNGGDLEVYANLTVRIMENETMAFLEGVEAHLEEADSPVYSTPQFSGSDSPSDANGTIGPITLLDRVYKSHHIPVENKHDLDLWYSSDAIWTKAIYNINMSMNVLLELETSDIWKPIMPLGFTVTDIPAEDALIATWDLNTDDTEVYSLWSNMSGDWELVKNLTATEDDHRIDQGLVHDEIYYFTLSAWDEVPLESNRTDAVMVQHVDGLAPEAPTGLVATEVNGTDLTIVWAANGDSDLEGYRVYINETGGDETGPWVLLTPSLGFTATTLWVQELASETTYHFVITAFDERPNESPYSQVVAAITDDITPPEAPVLDDLPEYTNVAEYTIRGTAEPGSTVSLMLNDLVVDSRDADASGDFAITVTLRDGENIFTAHATDLVGNVGPVSTSVFIVLDQDAPDPPALDLLPELTNVVEHTLTGTAEARSVVTVLLNDEVLGTVDADGDGAFELVLTLEEGENALTAFATDAALNDGNRATVMTVVLDTIAPEAPDVDAIPEYTNDPSLTVTGTAEGLSLVEVLVGANGGGSVTAEEDGTFTYSMTLVGRETDITARATDLAGNLGPSGPTQTIILDEEDPDAIAGEDKQAKEDIEVQFDASASTDNEDIASFNWTFDLGGTQVKLDGVTATYTFPDPVTLTVTLTVTDVAGNVDEDTLELVVLSANNAPLLRRDDMSPTSGHSDTEFQFSVEFKDEEGDTGEVWVVIDGESLKMTPDPDDTDTTDGQMFTYTTKLSTGNHTYYFTAKDSFGNDAEGPSAGEDKAKTSAEIEEKKTEDSPGSFAILAAMAMLIAVALHRSRRYTSKRR